MSDALPPRARLAHVLRSLARGLPSDVGPLLDAPRFADGKAALLRMADGAAAAAAAMSEDEAAWMAEELLQRWSRIGEVALAPEVIILAPEEVSVGDRPVRVPLSLSTFGIEDEWQAIWEGAVAEPGGSAGVLLAQPPAGDEPVEVKVRVRVRAREKGGARCVLVAEASIRVRRAL